MADDVLALTDQEWQEHRAGDDPYWRAIGRDALRLNQPCPLALMPGCDKPTAIRREPSPIA